MVFLPHTILTAAGLNTALATKEDLLPAGGDATKFFRGDRTWATGPVGPGGPPGTTAFATGAGGLTFDTRGSLEAATVPVGVHYIRTSGFTAVGDGGGALYVRMQAVPATPTSKVYARSTDRFKLDDTGPDAINGGYWKLVPENATVRIEQVGGKADWNGAAGTDNYQPLLDALKYTAWQFNAQYRHTYLIAFGAGDYYFSQTWDIHEITYIKGVGAFNGQGVGFATRFFWPANTSGIIIGGNNTEGDTLATVGLGVGGGKLEGFSIHLSGTFDRSKFGVLMRYQASLENIGVFTSPGKGIYIRAHAGVGGAREGNANSWIIRDCFVHTALADYLHVDGHDAQGGHCDGFVTHGNASGTGGCGVRSDASFTNYFSGLQITGYGNSGVYHLGAIYQCLNEALAPTTTPGTDGLVWRYISAFGAANPPVWPQWVSGTAYYLAMPISDNGAGAIYYNPYVEGGTVMSHVPTPSMILGGTLGSTEKTNHFNYGASLTGVAGKLGVGSYNDFVAGTAEYTRNGQNTWVRVGGGYDGEGENRFGTNGGLNLLTFRRLSDFDASWSWGFKGNDISFTAGTGTYIWQMTTWSTTETFGRASPVKEKLVLFDPVLRDPANFANARTIGMRDAAPTTGEHARGEVVFNVNAAASGFVGWVCVTSGTPGTWKTFGPISA